MFLCLALLLAGQGVLAKPAAAPDLKTVSTGGVVIAVDDGRVTVAGEGFVKKITLLAVEEGYIIDGATGWFLSLSDLAPGLKVTAYYAPVLTRSIPPQAKSVAVVVGEGSEAAHYFKAGEVEKLPNGVRVLNDNRDQYVTITCDVLGYPQQMIEGGEFLAWYSVNTMSMPAQAAALRVLPLDRLAPDIAVRLGADIIVAGGQKLSAAPAESEDGTLLLPLRAICEALGYAVGWENENKAAVLRKGGLLVATVPAAGRGREAARLVNGVLCAPVDFFAITLGHTIRIAKE
jgi:hypothetical protein